MWVAKIKINGDNALFGNLAKKHNISFSFYPLSSHENNKELSIYVAGLLSGEDKNKKRLISDLKNNQRIMNFEQNKNLILFQIKESLFHKPVYKYNLIYIEPILIDKDGVEIWSLGSSKKETIIDFMNSTEQKPGMTLINIFKKKSGDFSILNIRPKITSKQKKAMELAIKFGYYNYPRKIYIKDLAKIAKISCSTFQAHLRKAEKIILPYYLDKSEI